MRIAILTDTGSGISKKDISDLGIHLIPLKFYIDNVEYEDLEEEIFYEKLKQAKEIHTSQPSIEDLKNAFDDILKYYDILIYIPISSGFSGTYSTAKMLSNEDIYKDRVYVADCRKVSVTQRYAILDTLKLIDKNYNPKEIVNILEKNNQNSTIYIVVDTLMYLKKGGRINPLVANVGELLRIKPILFSSGGQFDMFKKARTIEKAEEILLEQMKDDIANRFKCDNLNQISLALAYTKDDSEAKKFKNVLLEHFSGISRDIHIDPLSKTVACHIGPNALGAVVYKNFDEC